MFCMEMNRNTNRALMTSLSIEANGPAFVGDLISELDLATRSPERPNVNAHLSVFPANNRKPELSCRIDVAKLGLFPKLFYMDLFFKPGSDVIRCLSADGSADTKQLTVNRDGSIGIMLDRYSSPVGPKDAACLIVQEVLKRIS